jgi:hypothetical protein
MTKLRFVTDVSKGILSNPDPYDVWLDRIKTMDIKSSDKILIPACGYGTEIDILVSLYSENIISQIMVFDKYLCFTNSIKRKYPKLNVITTDFLRLNDNNMIFTKIIGNPPYNSGLITTTYPDLFKHPAMNDEKSGYIGFFIKALKMLVPMGTLEFIVPGAFMRGTGTFGFRKWLVDEGFDLQEIKSYSPSIFTGVTISTIVTVKIQRRSYQGKTRVIHINGSSIEIDYTKYNEYIIPSFINAECFKIYDKMINYNKMMYPSKDSEDGGIYPNQSKYREICKNATKTPTVTNTCKVIENINPDGSFENEYINIRVVGSNHWRAIAKSATAANFGVIAPGIPIHETLQPIRCISKEHAETLVIYRQSPLFNMLENGLYSSYMVHTHYRYMPMPYWTNEEGIVEPIIAKSREELYRKLGLNEIALKCLDDYEQSNKESNGSNNKNGKKSRRAR